MKRLLIIVMLAASMVQHGFAQKIEIKGNACDAGNRAIEYANVVLQTLDSTFVSGVTTGAKGGLVPDTPRQPLLTHLHQLVLRSGCLVKLQAVLPVLADKHQLEQLLGGNPDGRREYSDTDS